MGKTGKERNRREEYLGEREERREMVWRGRGKRRDG